VAGAPCVRGLDIHTAQDIRGFYGYLFGYQVLTSSASLRGYLQYILGTARRWKWRRRRDSG
jgi:poly-beta-1,6-N-acetyl-D-glucosamine synthase